MIFLYRIISSFLYPLLVVLIFLRKYLDKEHIKRYKEKIFISSFNVNRKLNTELIWFHAASVGELKSILPIINQLEKDKNNFEYLITTTTLSSSKIAENQIKNFKNIHHRFFPLDVSFLIKAFLVKWQPKVLFLVDSEIWPNLILLCKQKKIPVALINARITAKSFNRWMFFPKTAKYIFNSFRLCLTSNQETKNFLNKLNVENVHYCGNIKLIDNINIEKITGLNEKLLKNSKFWLAVSTHNGEENFCLDTHIYLKKKISNVITVIAPRHIDRVEKIKKLCIKLNLNTQVLNKDDDILPDKEIILINSFNSLLEFYKYSKSVFIGKSLLKRFKNKGGQNPIEAAKLGCKIYHGPFVYNFEEIYEILKINNISQEIINPENFSKNLFNDLNNFEKNIEKSSSLLNDLGNQTLEMTIKNINRLLEDESIKA